MTFFDGLRRLFGGGAPKGTDTSAPDSDEMSCEEALRLVQDFLDGELEDVSGARVRRHFEMCQRCYPHLRLEESFRAALRKATRGERASRELRERVLKVLEETAADR
jgi:anti-sigma factor (TIGR02949 family)